VKARPLVADSVESLARQVTDLRADGFAPTLAIAFASITHELAEIGRVFLDARIEVFGASSAGEICGTSSGGADAGEHVRERSIVALLCDLDPAAFRIRLAELEGRTSHELGAAAGRWARASFDRGPVLVMATGLTTDGEQIVRGLQSELGRDAAIFGGLAGDDIRFTQTFVFTSRKLSSQGGIVLAFDGDRVALDGVASSGWVAVGAEKTVTKAEGNVVHTIDDVPALDLYKDYLGLELDSDVRIPEYPLQVQRDGYSVLRAALTSLPGTRSLVYAGTVGEGAKVRFSCSPGAEITEQALGEFRALHARVPDPDALILFSCKGRHMALGPLAEDEVGPMQRLWGRPMIGFYTYGEIGRNAAGATDFHNETCVLVTLKET
jgi:hypothetical protein